VTEKLEFIDWRQVYTRRYEQHIYQRVLSVSVEQVSREEGLSGEVIQGIFKRVSNQFKKKDWSQVKRLSMDEISKRKGYRDFITLVSNVDTGNLLEVIDSHKQEEIIEVLKQQPLAVREQVCEVSIDMWAGFPKVITSVFPKATVVFDRFHVMKLVNEALNKMRKQVGVKLKGSRFLLLKNSQDLTELETEQLEQLLNQSACLRIAYEMKEEFREIYETNQTVQSGLNRMKKWLAQAQVFYPKAVQTIRAHLEGICNYFISRTTSGVMEGINNKAKLIMRQGYGFTNFDNFRDRLLASFFD
jgi:transposase